MKEYIEREAAIGCVQEHYDDAIIIALDKIPAADVRPVVLCRDCEYYQADCGWCGLLDIGMNVNGFCSRGEKREES